jgi:uncharacterized protein
VLRYLLVRKIILFGYLFIGVAAAQQISPDDVSKIINSLKNDESGQATQLAKSLLGKNGGNQLFYFPTNDEPATPKKYGLKYENVTFSSTDGAKLHGWFLPVTKSQPVKGTIIFSHGNSGALGYHLPLVDWLPKAGYQVFMYDYRGFGTSTGSPSRQGLIEDVEAAFSYIQQRNDAKNTALISFSHSLGGAKSIVALSRNKVTNLKAVITDAAFASYEEMAVKIAGRFGKEMVSDEYAPKDYVSKINVPLLIMHGTADEVVPFSQGQELFAAAKGNKTLLAIKSGSHGDSLARNDGEYRKRMLDWLASLE